MNFLARLLMRRSKGRWVRSTPLARTPKVTVVIPCYNYGRYLRQCVGSVLTGQPGIDLEVIIVDDKSTDDSLEIAQKLANEDSRVRIIAHSVNKRHIATYNDGLEAATGEFVLLLSADDLVTPGALTRAAELLTDNPTVGMVYGRAIHFFGDNVPTARVEPQGWIIWSGADWLRLRCSHGYNVVTSPEVVMRTSLLREFGGYRPDLPHAGDFEMWLRTAAVSDVGYLVGVDQALYRRHHNNMSKTMFSGFTAKGFLIDLRQRWESFEAVFEGVGANLSDVSDLRRIARRTLAEQALQGANYAFVRGDRSFPVADFEELASEIDPSVIASRVGRQFQRRKRFGMLNLPIHPLWAPSELIRRLENLVSRFRRKYIGV